MKLAFVGSVVLVALVGAEAEAQALRTARLEEPDCERLPFDHERLAELLAVELAVHGVGLVEGPADDVIRYDAVSCAEEGSAIQVVVERGGTVTSRLSVEGTSARGLALYLAELMRQPVEAPTPRQAEGRPARAPLHPGAGLDVPEMPGSRWLTVASLGGSSPQVDRADEEPEQQRGLRPSASSLTPAVLTEFLYDPQNRTALGGVRVGIACEMPFWKHLRLHLDGGLAFGRSWGSIGLGAASFGLWSGVMVGDADLWLELGPRLSLLHGWGLGGPSRPMSRVGSSLVNFTGIVRGGIRLSDQLSAVADFEAGSPLSGGIRVQTGYTGSRRGGIGGTFFVVRVGLAFR